ncbi:DUF4296 domain-containing protein [Polaribacter sp.]|uniref:DUF4296 domain-containing protein n=1 Tax=Polaribacter sp. TaxID=1920175 RepID=UPI003F6A1B70
MKKLNSIIILVMLCSCTSNTIFEKPKDLIPKDTMSLLVQEMMVASSATFIKNKDMERNINYMPLVYDKFKIDSVRFQTSNLYYMSKIDEYKLIFEDAKNSLKQQKEYYDKIKSRKDSIRQDSIKRTKDLKKKKDSLDPTLELKNPLSQKPKL